MNEECCSVYQLKVTLLRSKPPIWRRFLANASTDLGELHEILQVVMGWMGCHPHQYSVNGRLYGVPDPEWDIDEVVDETTVKLNQLLKMEKDALTYYYDFGDGWEHLGAISNYWKYKKNQNTQNMMT